MSAQPIPRLTPEDYLRAERAAPFRSEFLDGVMYAMAGGSLAHGRITLRLASFLERALEDTPCFPGTTDLRVSAAKSQSYFYPDVFVVCGEAGFADEQKDTLTNPVLIVEVLSPSTEALDRGRKFRAYREISSLREYVLVSQWEHRVEKFTVGDDGRWSISDAVGLDASIHLDSLNLTIPLAEIYRKVTLSPPPPIPKDARVETA